MYKTAWDPNLISFSWLDEQEVPNIFIIKLAGKVKKQIKLIKFNV